MRCLIDWCRLMPWRRLLLVASLAAVLGGTSLVAQGGYIHAKAHLAQLLLDRAWQQSLTSGAPARPWPWADSYPVAQLEIPSIALKQVVLSGASGRNLAFAPTHLQSSAAPNTGSTTVLSAHRDTHFRRLQELYKGDLIVLHSLESSQQYRISGIEIADIRHQELALDSGDRLLLVTCYPFASLSSGGPLRYVISAEPMTALSDPFTPHPEPVTAHAEHFTPPIASQTPLKQPQLSQEPSSLNHQSPVTRQMTAQLGTSSDWVF